MLVFSIAAFVLAGPPARAGEAEEVVSFKNQVAPILASRCAGCHSGAEVKGGYRVNSFVSLTAAGDSGLTPFVAGDLPGSYAYELLASDDADLRMPREAEPLSTAELELFRHWIEQGATFDGPDPKAALHSYLPQLVHPDPPETYRLPLPVTAVAISPDGTEAAVSGYHEVTIWSLADGRLVRRIKNVAERIYSLAYSADGARLVVAGGTPGVSGELRVFDPVQGVLVREVERFADVALGAVFSPDGAKLAVCGADRAIRIYDAASYATLTTIEDHADWVTAIAFSPDGTRLASASRDKTSKVFDVASGDALSTYPGYGDPIYSVAFFTDGEQIIVGGRAGRIDYWKASDGSRAAETAVGGELYKISLAGGQLYTASSDAHARQFKADDRAAVRDMSGHTDRIYCLAVNESVKRLVTGSFDGEVRVWNTDDGSLITAFQASPGFIPADTTAQAAR